MLELDERIWNEDHVRMQTLVRCQLIRRKLEWFLDPRITMKMHYKGVSSGTVEMLSVILARIYRKMDTGDEVSALDNLACQIHHFPGLSERVVTFVNMLRMTARESDIATDADWDAWMVSM